jgi:hypothetical protein
MTKHTKGPWRYTNNGFIISIDALVVAEVSHDVRLSMDAANANYKLMAASPDMIEALEETKKWFSKLQDWSGVGDPPIELIEQAIKKALGNG